MPEGRRDDRRLLGVRWIEPGASELVHLGALHLANGGTLDALAAAVLDYPTLSEAHRVAALDGLDRF